MGPSDEPRGGGASGTSAGEGAAATVRRLLALVCWLALIAGVRCVTAPDVFVAGRVYFADADCYARMTRVREVMAHPGRILRHHEFENYPQGITPHTTAPLDYLIAPLAIVLGDLDLAGAWISPLLAVATGGFLWWWARRARVRFPGMLMLLYAVSPILAHGGALGRPDHQSLLLALLAVALAAEWMLASAATRGWEIIAGAAWGLGLWVSLYEPAIMLALVTATQAIWCRSVFRMRARWLALGGVLLVAVLLEGPRIFRIDLTGMTEFAGQPIGELASISILSPTLWRWVGLGLLVAPALLAWRVWREKFRRWEPVVVLAALLFLTLWQARWGYFFALAFALGVPWLFAAVPRAGLAWLAFVICLWPVAAEWRARLRPDETTQIARLRSRYEAVALRDVAEHLRSAETRPILAPWWLSPPLVYWSGQPALAGSSHESLPGILDSARFYAATDPAAARALLQARGIRRVVIFDPDLILESVKPLVPVESPESALATRLYRAPSSAPNFLQLEYANAVFKVFAVW